MERANKTPAGLTDAGWRRTGARAQEHAPGNACDPMRGHSSRVRAHPRESCRMQPAAEDEEQAAQWLAHAERLAQAPAQAAQARQWGSASRQQRSLLQHRWIWQTGERTCWALDSSAETGLAHSSVVADNHDVKTHWGGSERPRLTRYHPAAPAAYFPRWLPAEA